MLKLTTALLAGALLVPAGLTAQRQGPPPDAPRRMQGRAPRMGQDAPRGPGPGMLFAPGTLLRHGERLNLSEQQVSQLDALAAETRSAAAKADSVARVHEHRLQELWKADKPDANAIRRETEALMQARHAAGLTAMTNAAKAKALLNAEQLGRMEGWAEGRRAAVRRSHGGPPRDGRAMRQGPRGRRF